MDHLQRFTDHPWEKTKIFFSLIGYITHIRETRFFEKYDKSIKNKKNYKNFIKVR